MAQEETRKKKTGMARCLELASQHKGLVFISGILAAAAAVCSFLPYLFYLFYNAGTNRSFSRYGERKYERCSPIWLDGSRGDCRKCNPLFLRVDVFPSGGFRNAL